MATFDVKSRETLFARLETYTLNLAVNQWHTILQADNAPNITRISGFCMGLSGGPGAAVLIGPNSTSLTVSGSQYILFGGTVFEPNVTYEIRTSSTTAFYPTQNLNTKDYLVVLPGLTYNPNGFLHFNDFVLPPNYFLSIRNGANLTMTNGFYNLSVCKTVIS